MRCARSFLTHKSYEAITLGAIARRLKLTKGALYLYFPSREALFLEVLGEDLRQWLSELCVRLDRAEEWSPEQIAELFLTPGRPGLALMPILHVLERNVEFDVIRNFKELLLRSTLEAAEHLERSAPFLPAGSGARFLVCAHSIMVGFRQGADCGPVTDLVFKLPHLKPLRPDRGPALRDVLTAVLIGWGKQSAQRTKGTRHTPRGSKRWGPQQKNHSRSSASAAAFPAASIRQRTSTAS